MKRDTKTTEPDTAKIERTHSAALNERGMALMTVLVFSLVFMIGLLAFFTVAGYEASQAEVREQSTRAFFLADGAIERAKGELLRNGLWEGGYAWTNSDGGRYKLTVDRTSTWQGQPAAWFYAEGMFGRTKRDVEVYANIVPPALDFAILSLGDIDTQGNIDLIGHAHANGEMDGSHFQNTGTYDGGFGIFPPVAYTEPDSFPDATYYYVTAQKNPTEELYIKDRNGATLYTFAAGTPIDAAGELTWSINNTRRLSIRYQINGAGPHALDPAGNIFVKENTDHAVIINFGQGTPGKHDQTYIEIQATGNVTTTITPTIINARFTGTTVLDRLDKDFWEGDEIDLKTATTFAPDYCISVIAKKLDKANALASMGTANSPCLNYIMGDVDWSAGQFSMFGTLISLGDMSFGGGTNLNYDSGFIDCLPPVLGANWPVPTSGRMEVLNWNEPPPRAPS